MKQAEENRLDAALAGAERGRPFARGDLRPIKRALGREIPATVKHLWARFGGGHLSRAVVAYDADEVVDLLEQYAEYGLADLLPLACDGGARDFAVDLVGRDGLAAGTIQLNDRGTMTVASLQPIAADVIDFIERARTERLDFGMPTLASRWTEMQRAAAYRTPIAGLRGLGPNDYEIVKLRYATLVPAQLLPRHELELAGIPCATGEVHLDDNGRVTYATLARDHRVGDVECRAGSLLVLDANARPHRFTPISDLVIDGLRWKGREEITLPDEHLDVMWGTLAEPTTIGGIPCAAAAVRLDGKRAVAEGTLATDFEIDGVALPAGTWFERMFDSLYAIELPVATTIRGTRFEPGTKHVL